MITRYYLPKVKVNYKVADFIEEGNDIEIDNRTYAAVNKPLRGRSIARRLINTDETERLIIYA